MKFNCVNRTEVRKETDEGRTDESSKMEKKDR